MNDVFGIWRHGVYADNINVRKKIEMRGAVPKGCNCDHVKCTKFEPTHSGLAQLSMSYYVIEVSSACSLNTTHP
jgi:hypothetical protein